MQEEKKSVKTLRGRYDQILQNALIDVGKFKVEEFERMGTN